MIRTAVLFILCRLGRPVTSPAVGDGRCLSCGHNHGDIAAEVREMWTPAKRRIQAGAFMWGFYAGVIAFVVFLMVVGR